jgi:fluoroacetyl-CoA thioesterase
MTPHRHEPQEGAAASAEIRVGETDLASAVTLAATDAFPRVFATARLVALMEIAASRVLQPFLTEGEMSVGVIVETTHTAATPPGATVRAHARFAGRDGKFYAFDVWAEDEAGEIGRGRHSRAIVERARLEASAAKRRRGESSPR